MAILSKSVKAGAKWVKGSKTGARDKKSVKCANAMARFESSSKLCVMQEHAKLEKRLQKRAKWLV